MRILTLLTFVLFLGYTSNAQVADSLLLELENDTITEKESPKDVTIDIEDDLEEEETDTIRIRLGKKKFVIIEDDYDGTSEDEYDFEFDDDDDDDDDGKFKGHWDGLALGLNSYMKPNFETDLSPDANYLELNSNKSWEVGLNFGEKSFNLINNRIGLVTGIGVTFNNYKFDNNITLVPDSTALTYFVDTVNDFSKNKLTASYLTIPLLLEFQIPTGNNSKPVHFNAGVVGSLKLGSHTKQVYERNNKEYKDKVKEDFHLSPLRYGIHSSIGYGSFTIYGSYSMTTLFEKGEGPELYPFTIGIIIGG
jgi:outer membrane protein with beta-barrel domain